jgi:hypothetical protein
LEQLLSAEGFLSTFHIVGRHVQTFTAGGVIAMSSSSLLLRALVILFRLRFSELANSSVAPPIGSGRCDWMDSSEDVGVFIKLDNFGPLFQDDCDAILRRAVDIDAIVPILLNEDEKGAKGNITLGTARVSGHKPLP